MVTIPTAYLSQLSMNEFILKKVLKLRLGRTVANSTIPTTYLSQLCMNEVILQKVSKLRLLGGLL